MNTALRWLRDRFLFLRFLLPKPLRRRITHHVIKTLPSRAYMHTTLLPATTAAVGRRMLFVGAQSYNQPFYDAARALDVAVWSIDFDPDSAAHGAPNGHFVGDIKRIDALVGDLKFDIIMFNGIFGFGINTPGDAAAALEAMAKVARGGGLLVVGWNPGLTDGREMDVTRGRLHPAHLEGLPAVMEFPAFGRIQRHPHRYEIFRFGDEVPRA